MRLPLDDITNTVHQQQQPFPSSSPPALEDLKLKSNSDTPLSNLLSSSPLQSCFPSSQVTSLSLRTCQAASVNNSGNSATTRPKLLRQTSLLAFAANRQQAATASTLSSPCPTTSSSPLLSSSPPPPIASSSTSSSCPLHIDLPSDEGYSSTRMDLDCDDDSDEDEQQVEGEQEQYQGEEEYHYHEQHSVKRQCISAHHSSFNLSPLTALSDDPLAIARQARLAARNRANLFGETSRVASFAAGLPSFGDLARLREYSRGGNTSNLANIINSTLAGRHGNPYLNSFVSHYANDVYKCPSRNPHRDYAPPFACSFSKASKNGGKRLLAVSDEEGNVSLLDAEPKTDGEVALAASFRPHNNAVFDLTWSYDDRQIATASGDQSIVVSDAETRTQLHQLRTHTCSVKQVAYDPHNPNMLASASRDGSIGIWDLRSKPSKDGSISAVNHIRFAHDTYAKSRKGKDVARSNTRSVTSVIYLQQQDNLLASSGSADGVVKLWDLRKTFSKRINPPSIEESLDYTPVSSFAVEGSSGAHSSSTFSNATSTLNSSQAGSLPGISSSHPRTTRTHGISSLCLSPDGSRLYALATNSKIYVHDALYLSRPIEAPMHTFSSPTMHSTSFYVRIAISPDGRYLACGSSGADWQASIWDLHTHSAGTVYGETKNATTALKGHKHEIGGLDWANDILATCGDDHLVRAWRPNPKVASVATKDPNSRERWCHSGKWDMSS